MGALIGYARVSTRGQARDGSSLESQREMLLAAGATQIFEDAYTGTSLNRPELERAIATLTDGDTLIVTKVDRLARSLAKDALLAHSASSLSPHACSEALARISPFDTSCISR